MIEQKYDCFLRGFFVGCILSVVVTLTVLGWAVRRGDAFFYHPNYVLNSADWKIDTIIVCSSEYVDTTYKFVRVNED